MEFCDQAGMFFYALYLKVWLKFVWKETQFAKMAAFGWIKYAGFTTLTCLVLKGGSNFE